jgi:proteasome lid subunit RPN8/RPN11
MKKKHRFLRRQLKEMIRDANFYASKSGQEICGLLVDNGHFVELIRVKNKNKKGGGFEFDSSEIRFIQKAMEKMDHKIIGTFHSHPAYLPVPGDSDVKWASDSSFMLIIDVLGKKAGLWFIKNRKKREIEFDLI